ncbi:uncharacterized protein G2W53_024447 [Senna tora]|uniref:Uncharacterized protein n=1 Tax=Senna tora TaxID=362788 RepID=A0A834WDW6_9FABA|nr:uncharacterized protein G2W53_024447 [Senna tora]
MEGAGKDDEDGERRGKSEVRKHIKKEVT